MVLFLQTSAAAAGGGRARSAWQGPRVIVEHCTTDLVAPWERAWRRGHRLVQAVVEVVVKWQLTGTTNPLIEDRLNDIGCPLCTSALGL
jgi:hypothetical protein